MIGVNRNHVPLDSEHHGEEGARKYPAIATGSDVDDGIIRGGTDTGDPKDKPPKEGYGLTEAVDEDPLSIGKSDGRGPRP